ncbi:MAG: hypothetical protein R3B98_06510 [Hyphomonas sp.]
MSLTAGLRSLFGGKPGRPRPPKLRVSQVWSIRDDPSARVRILIARFDKTTIELDGVSQVVNCVHVSVTGTRHLELLDGQLSDGNLSHMPFTRAAVEASVRELTSTGREPPPKFEAAYQDWKRNGSDAVLTDPVAEEIELLYKTHTEFMKDL